MDRLRVGTLGAARITPAALIKPAREVPEVVVTAVAARDLARARQFATRHGISVVHDSYAALIADPGIDAIYNPLPNSLHCEWTIRALRAGKHVLCEKPIASNAGEAERLAAAARESGRVLVEAFHWRYHPLAERMRAILQSGEIGGVRHLEAWLCFPMLSPGDIRWRLDLAGGALMDAGCYPVSMVRHLAKATDPAGEPEVVRARSWLRRPEVDRRTEAELRFADGRTGKIGCSMLSQTLLWTSIWVRGDAGEMRVANPIAPQFWHRLRVRSSGGSRSERVAGEATYTHQLRAFVDAVRRGAPVPTGPDDAIANMRVVDAIYRAAGLHPRGGGESA